MVCHASKKSLNLIFDISCLTKKNIYFILGKSCLEKKTLTRGLFISFREKIILFSSDRKLEKRVKKQKITQKRKKKEKNL